jgi:8-oxo-dGTP pyrophosphatase MutT (NUDIX family)
MRVQYGALPYRLKKGGGVEVLLITSRTRGRWIIPKGWPIKGLTPSGSAAREAYEEAGVRGRIGKKPLGRFIYDKGLNDGGGFVVCEVTVFPLEVTRQLKSWPEIEQRETRWIAAGDATTLTDEDGLRPILEAFSLKMVPKRKRPPIVKADR